MASESFDGSFLGDITDRILPSTSAGEGIHLFRQGTTQFTFTKVKVEKLTNWTDLAIDIVKGIFYLPSNNYHTGTIESTITDDKDGTETITRSRYLITKVQEGPKINKGNNTDLIKKMYMFCWIMRVKNITEQTIVDCGYGPKIHCKEAYNPTDKDDVYVFPKDIIRKWFLPVDYKGDISSNSLDMIFANAIQEYLKPYRSPLTLKYKIEKLLHLYLSERKTEIDIWVNDIVKNLSPESKKERVPEPKKLNLLPLPKA
jgi:hypothetical protein